MQEARTLAKFDHANVVRVRTFFEENDTAYLVMDYYEGVSLGTGTKELPQLCITASGHLRPISNHKNIKIACYSINFCDLRSNKFDSNLCAYLWKLFRPRSLSEYLKQKSGKISEDLATDIMMPVLDGLREVHEKVSCTVTSSPRTYTLQKTGGLYFWTLALQDLPWARGAVAFPPF